MNVLQHNSRALGLERGGEVQDRNPGPFEQELKLWVSWGDLDRSFVQSIVELQYLEIRCRARLQCLSPGWLVYQASRFSQNDWVYG